MIHRFAGESKQPNQALWLSKLRSNLANKDPGHRHSLRVFRISRRPDPFSTKASLLDRRVSVFVIGVSNLGFSADAPKDAVRTPSILIWQDPGDIKSRNLLYGSGSEKDQPHLPVTFAKEDMKGTSPKFDVRDQDGEKWKVKLGVEAGPEIVVSRLLWAVGYFTEEYYFVSDLKVAGLPGHLRRGQKFVEDGGARNVRLKRHPKHAEKGGEWHWRDNPFSGKRELNGMRVMMALVNNWDLKDDNNSLYEDGSGNGKGDLKAYEHSKFISHVHGDLWEAPVSSAPIY